MKASERAISLIKKFEGLRLTSYRCSAGKWTIGWGSTKDVTPGMTIDLREAELRLIRDLSAIEDELTRMIKIPLSQNQYDAIVSWAFNFGTTRIRASELIRKLNLGLPGVSDEFLRWVHERNPATMKMRKSPGLVRRRKEEKDLFDESSVT